VKKTVGGVPYTLVEEADTGNYNCWSNCIYERDDIQDGERFCFQEGDLEDICNEGKYIMILKSLIFKQAL
jgi:hypothetical protein